jgi:hypothetical protein
MTEPNVPAASRRTLLACAGAACVAALAGCSRYNSNNGGIAASQPASPERLLAGRVDQPELGRDRLERALRASQDRRHPGRRR